MSKSNTFENEILLHIFNNVAITNVGDAAGLLPSAAAGNLYFALHTADPDEAGNQSTNEAAYTGYARMALPRTSAAFNVSGSGVNLVSNLEFGACTANPGAPLTHFSIGVAASGATKILYSGTLSPTVTVAVGVIPRLTTAANMVTED